jgi:curli production assembly/transport component CsgG
LLEGGIISYDTNIITGGIGARYFGLGGSAKYRLDRITVYLRAVSTSNG